MNISLKSILLEILNEGPEELDGKWYDSRTCAGPFIIFKDGGKTLYVFGDGQHDRIGLNGDKDIDSQTDEYNTHYDLEAALDAYNGSEEFTSKKENYNSMIYGRIWQINGETFVATWNSVKQIKSIGMNVFIDGLSRLLKRELDVDIKYVKFNPYDGHNSDDTWNYSEFVKLLGHDIDLDKQKQQRALHVMAPGEKKKALYQMGVKPKTTGDIPDFVKRQLVGIDEKSYE